MGGFWEEDEEGRGRAPGGREEDEEEDKSG